MTAEILIPTYDVPLVAASFFVSALGAYSALAAVTMVRQSNGRVSKGNVLSAGIALGGVGIWSMHFLGMLAWRVDTALGYELLQTLASLLAAVAISSFALGFMATRRFSYRRLAVAGPLAGVGVAGMHFLGMESMRFGGELQWNGGIALLAVGIAVVAATAALWLAFHVAGRVARVIAALVMAAAVCAMHYTGMAAADVVCTAADRTARLPGLLYRTDLQALVVVVALSAVCVIGLDIAIQRLTLNPLVKARR
jgi:NO-binding membrane sensor protein with MHYT domain